MKPWHVLGLFLLIGLLAGCDSDKNTTAPVDTGPHLMLHFVNGYLPFDNTTWVVINSLAGDSILAVHYISGDTVLDAGNVGPRTTFSLATRGHTDTISTASVHSFPDVSVRDWIFDGFDRFPDYQDTLGWADFTVNMPSQYFDWCKVVYGNGYETFIIRDDTIAPAHLVIPVRYVEGGTLTAYCLAEYNSDYFEGYMISPPFQQGDTNYYTIELHEAERTSVTVSMPIEFLTAWAYRGASNTRYLIDGYPCQNGCSVFSLFGSAFPCDRWQLHVSNLFRLPNFNGYVNSTSFPSSVDIPNIHILFGFDNASGSIENLTIIGDPDLILYTYHMRNGAWFVNANGEGLANVRPVLPDSFLTMASWDIYPLPRSAYIDAYAAEPADGYDDILTLMYDYYDPFRYESNFTYFFDPEYRLDNQPNDSTLRFNADRNFRTYVHDPFNFSPSRQYRLK